MVFNSKNRFTAYNSAKEKVTFEKEYSKIEFTNSEIEIPKTEEKLESFTPSAELVEQAVTTSIKVVKKYLEKRIERFVYQYTKRATNIQAGSYRVPKFIFANNIFLNKAYEESIRIELSPLLLRGTNSFIYQLDKIALNYSKALTSKWSNVFDYNIRLTLFFLKGNEIIKKELESLVVQSIGFGENSFEDQNIQTPIITIQKDACLIEVMLTIVETNPAKVNAETVLTALNDNDENIKSKLSEFLSSLLDVKPEK